MQIQDSSTPDTLLWQDLDRVSIEDRQHRLDVCNLAQLASSPRWIGVPLDSSMGLLTRCSLLLYSFSLFLQVCSWHYEDPDLDHREDFDGPPIEV
jgi:hypothetical protein